MISKQFFAACLSLLSLTANAQDTTKVLTKVQEVADKFNIRMSGRAVFDAAAYFQNDASKEQDGDMNPGAVLRDIRLGFKGSYRNWNFKADISFASGKISMKDVFLQYNFNKFNNIRAGHYSVPFGLSSAYSSAKKEYFDEPQGNVFQFGRRLGIMHTIFNHNLWGSYGVFADNSAMSKSTDESGPQGYTLGGRFVWRPVMNNDYGLHVGISGMHVKAESDNNGDNHIAYKKTYLTSVDKSAATSIDITDAKWENKFTAEFQGLYRNWQLCIQYYLSHIGREADNSYNSDGFYVSARGIIVNPANYKYNYESSGVDNPDNKNLELMVGGGFLNLQDSKALENSYIKGMAGAGKMYDASAGLSFFWNKYVTLRLNYHHVWSKIYKQCGTKQVDVLQLRAQYLF